MSVPVSYRIVNKADKLSKNDYFRQMLDELLQWRVQAEIVTGNSWYASRENFKLLKDQQLGIMMGIKGNRLVSAVEGTWHSVEQLEIPPNGQMVYLKDVGSVKVFRTVFKNEFRHYCLYWPSPEQMVQTHEAGFKRIHDAHWGIEQFHRAIKQVCNIERFHVRDSQAIRNHLFCSLWGFVQLERQRSQGAILNWYQPRRDLFNDVLRQFILDCSVGDIDIPPQYAESVNA